MLSCQYKYCHYDDKTVSRPSYMMASSNGNIFPGEFPAQRPVTRCFDVFFDLRLNKWLSKQSRGWWFETLSYPLWRRCNYHYNGNPFEERPSLLRRGPACGNGIGLNLMKCKTVFELFSLIFQTFCGKGSWNSSSLRQGLIHSAYSIW